MARQVLARLVDMARQATAATGQKGVAGKQTEGLGQLMKKALEGTQARAPREGKLKVVKKKKDPWAVSLEAELRRSAKGNGGGRIKKVSKKAPAFLKRLYPPTPMRPPSPEPTLHDDAEEEAAAAAEHGSSGGVISLSRQHARAQKAARELARARRETEMAAAAREAAEVLYGSDEAAADAGVRIPTTPGAYSLPSPARGSLEAEGADSRGWSHHELAEVESPSVRKLRAPRLPSPTKPMVARAGPWETEEWVPAPRRPSCSPTRSNAHPLSPARGRLEPMAFQPERSFVQVDFVGRRTPHGLHRGAWGDIPNPSMMAGRCSAPEPSLTRRERWIWTGWARSVNQPPMPSRVGGESCVCG
jgi:hypothetical protein